MTPNEVLSEIQKLPLSDARKVADQLTDYLREKDQRGQPGGDSERREDEFERYLLDKGVASHIAAGAETDEQCDACERIEVEGEPLSETIIRERR